MLRERIAGLCGKCVDALQDEAVLNAVNDPVMAERVAGIIQERASSLLQSMK